MNNASSHFTEPHLDVLTLKTEISSHNYRIASINSVTKIHHLRVYKGAVQIINIFLQYFKITYLFF